MLEAGQLDSIGEHSWGESDPSPTPGELDVNDNSLVPEGASSIIAYKRCNTNGYLVLCVEYENFRI